MFFNIFQMWLEVICSIVKNEQKSFENHEHPMDAVLQRMGENI